MAVRGMPRTFTLEEILTEDEIDCVLRCYWDATSNAAFHANCLQIVWAARERIDIVLGPCSMRLVAYGIQYRCLHYRKPVKKSVRKFSKFGLGRSLPVGRRKPKEVDRDQWEKTQFTDQSIGA